MKKVYILGPGLASGGIESFIINAAKGLDKNKYDVALILALDDNGNKQFREDEIIAEGIPIYRTCDLGSAKRVLIHAKRLYRILRDQKVDVLHANMEAINGINLLVAWLARVPVRVCHSHNSASGYEEQSGKHITAGIYRYFMKVLCRLFSNRRCGCSSPAMKYLYGKNWEKMRNACVIHNGIDMCRFAAHPRIHNSNLRRIVTVGRLVIQKNPLFAINVIEQLYKVRQDFEYIWVGSGELADEVQRTVEEKGLQDCVKMLGVRGDVEKILAYCDVFFLPSLFEGFGIVFIEAQAVGLPCLVSDTVPPNADCGGCRFESLDAPASHWAQVLSDMLDGKISFMIDPEKLQKYDTSYTIKQLEKIYED